MATEVKPTIQSPILWRQNYYYYRLESESSRTSVSSDTESVYSIQDKETDVVRDTSDTDNFEAEYELESLSESDQNWDDTSSGAEEMVLDLADAARLAAAAVICDSSIEAWPTDGEDSEDNTSEDDIAIGRTDFWTCIQCKSQNNNPLFRYCDKCFQSCRQCKERKTYKCFPLCNSCFKDRKTFFPPRPRRHKKVKKCTDENATSVELVVLRSCLNGLSSQDSGIGSSQECPPLDMDKIIVPQHLSTNLLGNSSKNRVETCSNKRKRQTSESSLSEVEVKKPRLALSTKKIETIIKENVNSEDCLLSKLEKPEKKNEIVSNSKTETTNITNKEECLSKKDGGLNSSVEMCVICNSNPKNSVFLHGRFAHMCCCYTCAMRTWKSIKRCPMCNGRVNNVVKVFS